MTIIVTIHAHLLWPDAHCAQEWLRCLQRAHLVIAETQVLRLHSGLLAAQQAHELLPAAGGHLYLQPHARPLYGEVLLQGLHCLCIKVQVTSLTEASARTPNQMQPKVGPQ
jgi:hypothetical protein